MDAEYFKKEYLHEDKLLSKKVCKSLVNVTKKIDVGFVGSMTSFYRESGITLLQTKNINSFFLADSNSETIKITERFHNELKKSQINYKDILIARSGSFGKASIYLEKNIINSSDIIIIAANEDVINPFYLTAFLNSQLGVNQMIRFASGGLQGHVNLTIIEELEVPILEKGFQKRIEDLVQLSYSFKTQSFQKYQEVENLLLETIGLNNFQPCTDPVNVKSFKDSFMVTGRLDAEYYQKKYEEVVNHITTQKYDRLANIVNIKKSIEPGSDVYSDEGLPFIRVSDFNKFGLSEPDKKLAPSFCKENAEQLAKLKPKKETILFSKDGSVGTAYMLRSDKDFITSGAILHLTVKDKKQIIPEYLTLALNSKLVQMQAERDAGGSIILHWRIGEIENVVVPIIDYKKQEQIAALVDESFSLKKQSEQLLEKAKRAVEIAIEQDEQAALDFINS